jgi:hypothetical protein
MTEPTRAMVARADWNSILAGRRRKGRSASAGSEHQQQVAAPDGRR